MHVVQLLPALESGGVERGTLEIAAALVDAGHRATVISAGGRQVQRLTELGGEHRELRIGRKSPGVFSSVPKLRRMLAGLQPDIVHVRSRLPGWIYRLATAGRRRWPTVATLHGLNSVSRYSAIMLRADAVIAVSRTCQEYWQQSYPHVDQRHVRVVPRGVDTREFPFGYQPPEAFRRRLDAALGTQNAYLVCLPGRIVSGKGHMDLLDVLSAFEDVHALVPGLGSGDFRSRLLARASELGVARRIHLLGHRSDVRDLMAISNIVLSLSTKPESFGRTVAEALSLGRPVLGYDHGGVGEILADHFPHGRVAPENTRELVKRVQELRDQPIAPAPGLPYTLDNMCGATLQIYRELTGGKSAAA